MKNVVAIFMLKQQAMDMHWPAQLACCTLSLTVAAVAIRQMGCTCELKGCICQPVYQHDEKDKSNTNN